jgi:DNA ligase (NAD+)
MVAAHFSRSRTMSDKPVDSLDEAEATAELARLAEEIAGHDLRYHSQARC